MNYVDFPFLVNWRAKIYVGNLNKKTNEGMVLCGVVWYGMVWCGIIIGIVQCDMV